MTIAELSQAEAAEHLKAIRRLLEAAHDPPEMLDKAGVAAAMRLGESTVDKLRAAGKFGPQDIKIGSALRWRRAEVLAWLAHPGPDGELADAEGWRPLWIDLQRKAAKR